MGTAPPEHIDQALQETVDRSCLLRMAHATSRGRLSRPESCSGRAVTRPSKRLPAEFQASRRVSFSFESERTQAHQVSVLSTVATYSLYGDWKVLHFAGRPPSYLLCGPTLTCVLFVSSCVRIPILSWGLPRPYLIVSRKPKRCLPAGQPRLCNRTGQSSSCRLWIRFWY
jgi:hypothetical protein